MKNTLIALVLITLIVSSCTQENKKKMVTAGPLGETIKHEKDTSTNFNKCCASNIPARFPLKNSNIAQRTRSE